MDRFRRSVLVLLAILLASCPCAALGSDYRLCLGDDGALAFHADTPQGQVKLSAVAEVTASHESATACLDLLFCSGEARTWAPARLDFGVAHLPASFPVWQWFQLPVLAPMQGPPRVSPATSGERLATGHRTTVLRL